MAFKKYEFNGCIEFKHPSCDLLQSVDLAFSLVKLRLSLRQLHGARQHFRSINSPVTAIVAYTQSHSPPSNRRYSPTLPTPYTHYKSRNSPNNTTLILMAMAFNMAMVFIPSMSPSQDMKALDSPAWRLGKRMTLPASNHMRFYCI